MYIELLQPRHSIETHLTAAALLTSRSTQVVDTTSLVRVLALVTNSLEHPSDLEPTPPLAVLARGLAGSSDSALLILC